MPASLVPSAVSTFIDINGNPLVGGKIGMYIVGTLIPKDTWENAEQTVLNTNPIILNSRGQAIIYGVGSYRQILTDADDNLIWDQNIENFGDAVFGILTAITAATITNLGTVASHNILVQGSVTINSFGNAASEESPIYLVQFDSALTITNSATLILPNSVDLHTSPGDGALMEYLGALGTWRMLAYFPASGYGSLGTAAGYNIGTSGGTVPLLNGNNVWSGSQAFSTQTYGPEQVLTVATGAVAPNFAAGSNFTVSTGVNLTINNPTNVQAGQSGILRVTQTSGSLTATWGTAYKAPGGIASVNFSGINGAIDYFAYYAHAAGEVVITPLLNIS